MKRRTVAPDDLLVLEKANRDGKLIDTTNAMKRTIAENLCKTYNEKLTEAEKERGVYWMTRHAAPGAGRAKPGKKSGKTRGSHRQGVES
jgi:hypothetical protein